MDEALLIKIIGVTGTLLAAVFGFIASRKKSSGEAMDRFQSNVIKQIDQLDDRAEKYWERAEKLEDELTSWKDKYKTLSEETKDLEREYSVLSTEAAHVRELNQRMQDREEDYRACIESYRKVLRQHGLTVDVYDIEP